MNEKSKTIILLLLVLLAVVFIVYVWGGYTRNFIQSLR